MATPNYQLRDDHVTTAKHLRDERARNDSVYVTNAALEAYRPDTIVNANGTSYLVADATELLNGATPLNMNTR
jgi:hypothetical protein